MADDVKTGIRIEVSGKADFVKDLTEAAGAMNDAADAAGNVETNVGNAGSALENLGSGSAASTKQFTDNVDAASWQAIADFLNVIDVILEVNAVIAANVNETAEMGDAIAKGAQEIGFSTEAYQRWDFILKKNNSSIEKSKSAIQTLTKASSDASKKQVEAFDKLGLSMEDVQAMAPEELFATVVAGLQNIEDMGDRASIASALFGSGGYKQLDLLLGSTNEETSALSGLADKLGAIMSDENVANATALMDATEDLNTAIDSIKRTFGEGLTDEFADLRNGLTDLLTAVDWEGLARAFEAVYTPALNFLNDFLIPFASLNVVGITGILSTMQKVLQTVGEVVRGEKTVTEGLDELWTYGQDELDLTVQFKDAPETLGQIQLMGQALKDLQNNLIGIEEVDEVALGGFDSSVDSFIQNAEAAAEGAENAAEANAWLEEQVRAASEAVKAEALADPMAGMDDAKAQAYAQALGQIYQQYQAILEQQQQAPAENDPAAQLTAAAEASTEAAETVKGNAESMLADLPATTGEIVTSFEQGASEMSQAAAKAVEETNTTMAANMATLSGNAYIWGGDMMLSLAQGILDGAASYVSPAVASVAGDIESMLGFSEPERGPLSNFHTFAPDMMALFAQGILDGRELIRDAIGETFDLGPMIAAQSAGQSFNYGGVNVVINASEGQSAEELYEVFSYRLQHDVVDREAAYR